MKETNQDKSYFPSKLEKDLSEFGHTSKWFWFINAPWIIGAIAVISRHFYQAGK